MDLRILCREEEDFGVKGVDMSLTQSKQES